LNTSRKSLLCGITLLGLVALGCGQDDTLTPVQGRVFYRGEPLRGGTIVFTPDPERGGHGPLACGEIGTDGRYQLRTGSNRGVVPGWHRVSIAPASPRAATGSSAAKPHSMDLPSKYRDPDQSGLLCEIKTEKVAEQDFHLE
jgi:hypothetical protein